MRVPEEGNRPLTYRELAPKLAAYIQAMGFTHVEFLPIMEHPLYASWATRSLVTLPRRGAMGRRRIYMYLIDYLHQQGIGVILDWVPSHFLPTSMARATSTARISMSMPMNVRGCIQIGERDF